MSRHNFLNSLLEKCSASKLDFFNIQISIFHSQNSSCQSSLFLKKLSRMFVYLIRAVRDRDTETDTEISQLLATFPNVCNTQGRVRLETGSPEVHPILLCYPITCCLPGCTLARSQKQSQDLKPSIPLWDVGSQATSTAVPNACSSICFGDKGCWQEGKSKMRA